MDDKRKESEEAFEKAKQKFDDAKTKLDQSLKEFDDILRRVNGADQPTKKEENDNH